MAWILTYPKSRVVCRRCNDWWELYRLKGMMSYFPHEAWHIYFLTTVSKPFCVSMASSSCLGWERDSLLGICRSCRFVLLLVVFVKVHLLYRPSWGNPCLQAACDAPVRSRVRSHVLRRVEVRSCGIFPRVRGLRWYLSGQCAQKVSSLTSCVLFCILLRVVGLVVPFLLFFSCLEACSLGVSSLSCAS